MYRRSKRSILPLTHPSEETGIRKLKNRYSVLSRDTIKKQTENIGVALDKAFAAIERENTSLEGVMTATKLDGVINGPGYAE